jgi:hypothetical protein
VAIAGTRHDAPVLQARDAAPSRAFITGAVIPIDGGTAARRG